MNTDLRKKVRELGEIPNHIAIIMDGNGRWAKSNSLPRAAGHKEGINSVREIVRVCGEMNISYLTLYTFSSENWNRPKTEVSAIMKLLFSTIKKEINNLHKNNVRLTTIGNLNDLPPETKKNIENGMIQTSKNTGLNLILALSYGSRQELIRAIKRIGSKIESSQIKPDEITEDLLVGEAAYSELLITNKFWPEFREDELLNGIIDYQKRQRRFGQTAEQVST